MAASYQLALIARNAEAQVQDFELLLTPQRRPSPLDANELRDCDADLFDLPSAPLPCLAGGRKPNNPSAVRDERISEVVHAVETSLVNIGLKGLNVLEAVKKIVLLFSPAVLNRQWRYWKLVEEPEFGPATPLHTIIFMTDVDPHSDLLSGGAVWMDSCTAMDLLINPDAEVKRIGRLATYAFSPHFPQGLSLNFALRVRGQKYPPGFLVVPMDSCTAKPFTKTNLVVFAPTAALGDESDIALAAATGSALIVDPGCSGPAKAMLGRMMKVFHGRLLVFLTHHHYDHIDGLSTVKENASEVVLVAHQTTFRRMGTAVNNFKCIAVTGGNKLHVAGQEVEVISAPGHTDGHLGLFHRSTGCLIVGDHCVGQGSSILDANSGGSMKDYMETTRRFLSLHPKVIVPMHGRPNYWPMHMLNEYMRHRVSREGKILKAIEGGAQTAFDIASQAYSDTSPTMWPAALLNIKLHVEHLAYLQKLPSGFSVKRFQQSCGGKFLLRCVPVAAGYAICKPLVEMTKAPLTNIGGGVSVAVLLGAFALMVTRK